MLLSPIFFFLFHSNIQFDRVETNYLQLSTAVGAFDRVALVRVFVHLDFSITFGACPSWHLVIPPQFFFSLGLILRVNQKYLSRNDRYLQEAIGDARDSFLGSETHGRESSVTGYSLASGHLLSGKLDSFTREFGLFNISKTTDKLAIRLSVVHIFGS